MSDGLAKKNSSKALRAVIDRIEEDQEGRRLAVLCVDDGQELIIALDKLPPGVEEGASVVITITLDAKARRAHIQGLPK